MCNIGLWLPSVRLLQTFQSKVDSSERGRNKGIPEKINAQLPFMCLSVSLKAVVIKHILRLSAFVLYEPALETMIFLFVRKGPLKFPLYPRFILEVAFENVRCKRRLYLWELLQDLARGAITLEVFLFQRLFLLLLLFLETYLDGFAKLGSPLAVKSLPLHWNRINYCVQMLKVNIALHIKIKAKGLKPMPTVPSRCYHYSVRIYIPVQTMVFDLRRTF